MCGAIVPVNSLKGRLYHLIEHKQQKEHAKRRPLPLTAKPSGQNMPPQHEGGNGKHADHQHRHHPGDPVMKVHGTQRHQKTGHIGPLPFLVELHILLPGSLHRGRKGARGLPGVVHPPAIIIVVDAHHIVFSQPEKRKQRQNQKPCRQKHLFPAAIPFFPFFFFPHSSCLFPK